MYQITDLKIGVTFELNGDIYRVLYSEHSKTGRAGAVLRTKIKNLVTGAIIDKTFKGSDKFEPARLDRKDCQYLYKEGNELFFMDNSSYEQFSLSKNDIKEAIPYIKEGESATILFFNGKPIGVDLPPKVVLKVTYAEEGVRGDTVSPGTKSVTLETGLNVQVPLFIKEGDKLRINTQTGDYVERA